MTTLEARVASLEVSMSLILQAVEQIAASQTMFSSVVTAHLRRMIAQVDEMRDHLGDDEDWS